MCLLRTRSKLCSNDAGVAASHLTLVGDDDDRTSFAQCPSRPAGRSHRLRPGVERSAGGQADAQQCAPAPMPAASTSAQSGQTAVPRTVGDPLVIANPGIEVFRVTPETEPEQQGDNERKWSLHPMAPFVRLEVMTINGDASSCVARRITGSDTLQFELVEDGHMAFEDFIIYRDPGPDEAQRAVIVSRVTVDLKFKREDEGLRPSGSGPTTTTCTSSKSATATSSSASPTRESARRAPASARPCRRRSSLVRLCTNDACTAMP